MQLFPECYACLVRQAVSAMNSARVDQITQISTIKEVLRTLEKADDSLSPSDLAGQTNQVIREIVGINDLYKEIKRKSHILAEEYLEDLINLSKEGNDKLEQGLKISAAGNVIDVVHANDYDLWDEVITTVNQELLGGGVEAFRQRIDESPYLLYLADNVGETIFDRVFIETLDIPVIYGVKGGPILNDATREDAFAAGIEPVATIIDNGSNAPGALLNQCSELFRKRFAQADLIIAKGQANYESLSDSSAPIFFLLQAKCNVIARDLGVTEGGTILKQQGVS